MGMLDVPRESNTGLAGKRGPNLVERVIKWKKAKPSKNQEAFKKEFRKGMRGAGKMLKEIYNGDDGW